MLPLSDFFMPAFLLTFILFLACISCFPSVSTHEKFLSQHLLPARANIYGTWGPCKSAYPLLLSACSCLTNNKSNNNKSGENVRLEEEDDRNAWVMPIAMVKWWSGSAPTTAAATTNAICIGATGRVIAVKKPAGCRNVVANVWTNINKCKSATYICESVCVCVQTRMCQWKGNA